MQLLYLFITITTMFGILHVKIYQSAGLKYLGCFRDADRPNHQVLKGYAKYLPELTIDLCLEECKLAKMVYFGVEQINMCYCGRDGSGFQVYGNSSDCITPCAGNTSQKCGGQFAIDIYKIEVAKCSELKPPLHGTVHQGEDTALFECLDGYRLRGSRTLHCNKSSLQWTTASNRFINPICYYTYGNRSHPTFKEFHYIGCFRDVQNDSQRIFRDHGRYIPRLTLRSCHTECATKKATYFGVEDSSMCYCGKRGSNFRIYGRSEECVHHCDGNNSQTCGGRLAIDIFKIGRQFCLPVDPPINGKVIQTTTKAWFECLNDYCLHGMKENTCNISTLRWDWPTDVSCQPCNSVIKNISDDTEIALLHPTQVRGNSVSVYVIGLLIFLCTCLGFVCGLPITRKLVRRKLGGNNAVNSNDCHQSEDRAEHIFQEVPPSNSTILHQTNSVVYRDLGFEGKTSPQSGRKRGEIVFEEDSLYIQMHPICNSGVRWWTVNDTN